VVGQKDIAYILRQKFVKEFHVKLGKSSEEILTDITECMGKRSSVLS
jgi:hypothetical protein